MILMRFASAAGVATPAINIRRLFQCCTLRTAVLFRLRSTGTWWVRAFLSIVSGHGFLPDLGFVLWSSAPASKVGNERDHSQD